MIQSFQQLLCIQVFPRQHCAGLDTDDLQGPSLPRKCQRYNSFHAISFSCASSVLWGKRRRRMRKEEDENGDRKKQPLPQTPQWADPTVLEPVAHPERPRPLLHFCLALAATRYLFLNYTSQSSWHPGQQVEIQYGIEAVYLITPLLPSPFLLN